MFDWLCPILLGNVFYGFPQSMYIYIECVVAIDACSGVPQYEIMGIVIII